MKRKGEKSDCFVSKLVPLLHYTPSTIGPPFYRNKRSVEEVLLLVQNTDRRRGG